MRRTGPQRMLVTPSVPTGGRLADSNHEPIREDPMYIYGKRRRRPARPVAVPKAGLSRAVRPAAILDLAAWRDRLAAANAPEQRAA